MTAGSTGDVASERVGLIRSVTRRLLICLGAHFVACVALFALFRLVQLPTAVLMFVVAFGMLGGFVGIQRRIRRFSRTDLQLLASSWPYALLSPFIGGLLAVILYCLFMSKMVEGQLFPHFEPGPEGTKDLSRLFEAHAEAYTDYAKLVIWSFLAGFSENLVTDIVGVSAKLSHKNMASSEAE